MKISNLLTICLVTATLSACHSHKTGSVDVPVVPISTTNVGNTGTAKVDRLPVPTNAVPAAPRRVVSSPAPVSQNQQYVRAMNGLGFETAETSRGVIVYLPPSAHFDTGKSNIKTATDARLRQFVNETNKSYVAHRNVIVSGHTDSVGNNAANQALSARRASTVQSRLTNLGFSSGRLSSQGFGETSPRYTDSSSQHLNRRVEFLVLN